MCPAPSAGRALVWLAPVIGCVAYIILGINRVRRKALRLHNHGTIFFTLTGKTAEEIEKEVPASLLQLLAPGIQSAPAAFGAGQFRPAAD